MDFKTFCSWNCKYPLLLETLKNFKEKVIIIDVATGVGNDLNRWIALKDKIKYVIGIDNDKNQIKEAIKRYKNMVKNKEISVSYYIDQANQFNKYIKGSVNGAFVITCNFALNYFIDDPSFYENLAKMPVDTYFIGIATDSDKLNKDSKFYYFENVNEKEYKFSLETSFFKRKGGHITEKRINKQELVNMMKSIGYEVICMDPISTRIDKVNTYKFDMSMLDIYFYFSFKKIS